MSFKVFGSRNVIFVASIYEYESAKDGSFYVLKQNFENHFVYTNVATAQKLCTMFPSFRVEKSNNHSLGFVAMGGIMAGDTDKHFGRWATPDMNSISSGLDSGPLVLFEQERFSSDTLVISPFKNFMDVQASYDLNAKGLGTVSWGVIGSMKEIPKDYETSFIVYHSSDGIREAIEGWGETLRKFYDRNQVSRFSDFTNNYLGYYMDNGAYYYYTTESKKNYQDTIIDIRENANTKKLPYRYVQYDSWWYYQSKIRQGVTKWASRPEIFPNGMQYMLNKTGWPVVAHNRWFSPKNVYAKQNGGDYDFVIEYDTLMSLPLETRFWTDLFTNAKKWGLTVYEQDWMNRQSDKMRYTTENIGAGRNWLMQMGQGAAKTGINIQFCMTPFRTILQTLEIPAVSQVRVSQDYFLDMEQWRIGMSSHFIHALGLAPFKDNFWTTTSQPGNPYDKQELYPALESLVATLSTGSVGPSDKIGLSNVSLIMSTCNADGLILKPSYPARTIDIIIKHAAFDRELTEEIWTTESRISNFRFAIILATDIKGLYVLNAEMLKFGKNFPLSRVYQYGDASISGIFGLTNFLTFNRECTRSRFCLFYASPFMKMGTSNVALLGELSKWVPMSPNRVHSIEQTNDDIRIIISGALNEMVDFSFQQNESKFIINCKIGTSTQNLISIRKRNCIMV